MKLRPLGLLCALLALARALRALDLAECEREHERRACARACGTRGPFVQFSEQARARARRTYIPPITPSHTLTRRASNVARRRRSSPHTHSTRTHARARTLVCTHAHTHKHARMNRLTRTHARQNTHTHLHTHTRASARCPPDPPELTRIKRIKQQLKTCFCARKSTGARDIQPNDGGARNAKNKFSVSHDAAAPWSLRAPGRSQR